jgi:hypothetical protein
MAVGCVPFPPSSYQHQLEGANEVFALIGALVGVAAARGVLDSGGIIAGLLLGPFAFLMFLVSGVSRSDANRECSHCAEFVKAETTICKHSRQPVIAVNTR